MNTSIILPIMVLVYLFSFMPLNRFNVNRFFGLNFSTRIEGQQIGKVVSVLR